MFCSILPTDVFWASQAHIGYIEGKVKWKVMFEHLGSLSPHQYDLCNTEHSSGMVPFICYYQKVRSSICISQKPYNGKRKLHWRYEKKEIKKTLNIPSERSYFNPYVIRVGKFVCLSIDWLPSGRINCTEQMWFRAHQNTNECRSLLRKHNSKEGISGLAWLPPHWSQGTCKPKFRQIREESECRQMRSDCGSHGSCRDHQILQFLPTLHAGALVFLDDL